jgi:hypothetical protein
VVHLTEAGQAGMLRENKFSTEKDLPQIAQNAAVLPLFLRPKKVAELVRLGKDNDGGYLVDKQSIISSEFMLGFGISDDWSFEKDFKKCINVPIIAFDASMGLNFFLAKLRVAIARGSRKSIYWFRVSFNYLNFFRGSNRHIKKFIGIDESPNRVSVNTISKNIIPKNVKNLFFKIDIEGSEYQILDDLIAISDRICGLVIEFHFVDVHMEKIESFVRKFPLKICHMHCNNYGPLNESSTPSTIEATFTKFDVEDCFVENLPNPLDLPNKFGAEDYSITFL